MAITVELVEPWEGGRVPARVWINVLLEAEIVPYRASFPGEVVILGLCPGCRAPKQVELIDTTCNGIQQFPVGMTQLEKCLKKICGYRFVKSRVFP